MQSFAKDEADDLALLTAHHYITGQANPAATIEFMLAEEKKYQPALSRFQEISQAARIPWRMCETASFSGGGKAGVSDTFASALWALDYLFVLASYGASGANMQTGVNHLGVVSKYTSIHDDLAGHYTPAPEYYGLLAFAQAGKGEQLGVTLNTGGVNLTAYATHFGSTIALTIINKDMRRDASVSIAGISAAQARVMRLTAPSLTAASGITLGGAAVDGSGKWSGKSDRFSGGKLAVPSGSAALVTFSL
jgi:hypothetical protein